MKYKPGDVFWPITFAEWNIEGGDIQIRPEDIESYAYPPGERHRYTQKGWDKALALGIAVIRLADQQSGAQE